MSLFANHKTALILAPHTDDGEFGCGGTITKMLKSGITVYYAAFSSCEESVPEGFPSDILQKELYNATNVLGIPKKNVFLFNFKVRKFKARRQEILEEMINLRKHINPSLIFTPSSNDIHQDHQTIYEESIRAFKFKTILGYELPWNNFSTAYNLYVELDEINVSKKIKAINMYESQASRIYSSEQYLKSHLFFNGTKGNLTYSEVFEIIRMYG